jgi:metal-responsive CopG/Arc/MetJ family transcriptional regulator
MKTAISIPDTIYKSAERAAHKLRISRSKFFAVAATHYLREIQTEKVTDRLNAVYFDPLKTDSRMPAPIAKLQSAVLKRDSW